MKNFIFLSIATFLSAMTMNAQLVDVIVEEFGIPEPAGVYPAGHMTYRVYARVQDPTDFVSAVYGIGLDGDDPAHTLALGWIPGTGLTSTFWNSAFGGVTGPDINPAFCGIFAETCYDSFLTIGRASSQDSGNAINVLTTPPGQLNPTFGNTFTIGQPSSVNDGAWFALSGDVNGFPVGDDHRVLLMQLTCPQDQLLFAINLQIFDEGVGANSLYYCHTLEGDPGELGTELEQDFTCHGLVYPPIAVCPGCNDPLACNYSPLATNTDNCVYATDCETEVGCMDESACNYEPLATFEIPFSCEYPGCMNPLACNFDEYADCDNGLCEFESGLFGNVFFDSNQSGTMNSNEPGVGNVLVHIMPEDVFVFTDSEGYFEFSGIADGLHNLEIIENNAVWEVNLSNLSGLETPRCNGVNVALVSDEYVLNANASFYFMNTPILCVSGFNPALTVTNNGTLPLNGTLTLTCDPLFTFYEIPGSSYVAPDIITPGVIVWNVTDLQEFESAVYGIHVNGPGTDYVGQYFEFSLILSLYDDQGNLFYLNDWTTNSPVTCAYDPNDKTVVSETYNEEFQFVGMNDPIEYRIRFQNTGNMAAENVLISDTLDLEYLDINTFEPQSSSHNMMTELNSDGSIKFVFNNILLPDSASNEAGSHGFVVYRISPREDVQHMDLIENTSHIFFDDNPPIITNTTKNYIFDCNSLTGILSNDSFCVGDVGYFNAEQSYIDQYTWTFDDTVAGTDPILAQALNDVGTFNVSVTISNPLCSLTDDVEITVNALPETDITQNGAVFNAPEGTSWQWYQNGEVIEGATSQTFEATESGYYEVFVTNEAGCAAFSEEVMFVHLSELSTNDFALFPNPMLDQASLLFPYGSKIEGVVIIDPFGRIVKSWNQPGNNRLTIERSELSPGSYAIRITEQGGGIHTIQLVVQN
jgi:uncharacterized repeat protein (TIGR01451 family)